ncbi:MAG TPA: hypothetical protein VGA65_01270 [Hyphomicrobium sp.]|jgi:hypothetical protein
MSLSRFAAGLIAAATLCATVAGAEAGTRYGHGPILGKVTAHSHFGNGSVTAPYRKTPVGYQIRLPHGTWVYCRTSCRETLRVQTVDIWDAVINNGSLIGAGTLDAECGVLGCLTWSRDLPF